MNNTLFALIDCNNFYVSCERVFNPSLRNKPVMVLSNNDGCVIARSQEVKDLGIAMGVPAFKCESLIRRHNIQVFSSNYPLYGDMSARVMHTIHAHVPELEVYSIDEAFIQLSTSVTDPVAFGLLLKKRVLQWTGIPISIGIGSTKTLAKVANHIAKKQKQHNGVYDIMCVQNSDDILEQFAVEDVWGIGRQYTKLLQRNRITNARQLKYAKDAWVQKKMTIVGLRTVHELRGITCFSLDTQPQAKQTIAHTRSFGERVTELSELKRAVAGYAVQLARKVREEKMLACTLYVFIMTSRHTQFKYYASKTVELAQPTSYTPDIISAACNAVSALFSSGYSYKKAGIVATELLPEDQEQLPAFVSLESNTMKRALMQEIDALNQKWGSGTVGFAAQGTHKDGGICQSEFADSVLRHTFPCGENTPHKRSLDKRSRKRLKKSQAFTTKWDDLLLIKL